MAGWARPRPLPRVLPNAENSCCARYLTPDDLADILAVPLKTLYAWRKKRTGPPAFRIGKHLRYDPTAVHDWITTQQTADAA